MDEAGRVKSEGESLSYPELMLPFISMFSSIWQRLITQKICVLCDTVLCVYYICKTTTSTLPSNTNTWSDCYEVSLVLQGVPQQSYMKKY